MALAIHPGQLTAEFRDGQRVRAISPWRLTFNIIAIFFVLSFVTDFRVASFPKQDPSGTLANAISVAAQHAKVDSATFTALVDRRFNAIFTLLVTLSIAASAILTRLTHWRRNEGWSVHFVFALHLTAWSFVLNLVYYAAMRSLGLSIAYDAPSRGPASALLALILLWQFGYVLFAFRRVYADGWIGASAKAGLMVASGLLVGSAAATLSFWLAVMTALHVR